ncbi:methylphosphonate degradation complex subunit PhnL [Dongia mobilis]|uniref:Methylphosphonate degradation complex subunit PhnL n=2 Tax=Dongia mobilis TaxID=578943 RepID=A0A4V3DFA2_9PROT|nr:methylphosphonate degradation complex subunit PhnL [Dongia mobilis]
MQNPAIAVTGISKTFRLHTQGGTEIAVFRNLSLGVDFGTSLALHGPSGSGKSTLLRTLYGNYRVDAGSICIRHDAGYLDLARAAPRQILAARCRSIGYVSQFLRVIPRVATLDIVADPLRQRGVDAADARARAGAMLERLNVPARLWPLAPATFSGGEQQRINIARGFVADFPILLLDEPTASLDAANRDVVVDMISEARAKGCAIVGIFHDADVRAAACDRVFELAPFRDAA